jgi:hypothetical protein
VKRTETKSGSSSRARNRRRNRRLNSFSADGFCFRGLFLFSRNDTTFVTFERSGSTSFRQKKKKMQSLQDD